MPPPLFLDGARFGTGLGAGAGFCVGAGARTTGAGAETSVLVDDAGLGAVWTTGTTRGAGPAAALCLW